MEKTPKVTTWSNSQPRVAKKPHVTLLLSLFMGAETGKAGAGDTTANKGQCVGLVEKWADLLKLPHIWGNAADLLSNADKSAYGRITNTPTNYPSPGDIVVW